MKIQTVLKKRINEIKDIRNLVWLDRINVFQNEMIIIICIIFVHFYENNALVSVRNAISDTISLSSIILGILGVLIGTLSSFEEDSAFFKKAREYNKNSLFNEYIIIKLEQAFLLNILFLLLTISFNLVPPNNYIILKRLVIGTWLFLLIKIVWQVSYLIIVITKIST